MNFKKIRSVLYIIPFFLAASIMAQKPIVMTNVGKMNVAPGAQMYVDGSIHMYDPTVTEGVQVLQNGTTTLTGDFYQDSHNHVFDVDIKNYTTSTGIIRFAGDEDQTITSKNSENTFNRAKRFIAFPTLEIASGKSVFVQARLGIDANNIAVSKPNGQLHLRSNYTSGEAFDASLRIIKPNISYDDDRSKAPAGAVVVEKSVLAYRDLNTSVASSLMPFASPFEEQLSGYFAGNWVRSPQRDAKFHTQYPYADKTTTLPLIDLDQYVIDPQQYLKAGDAYLIKPRAKKEFDNLIDNPNSLEITGGGAPNPEEYKKDLFVFNSQAYNLQPASKEALMLKPIFNEEITGDASKTINILIGNSYTAPIDLVSLSSYMLNHASLYFNRYIWIFMPGSNTYVSYDAYTGQGGPVQPAPPALITNKDIPSMGVFMIRLAKRNSTGRFTIDRTRLKHGNTAHNLKATEFKDEVFFEITKDGNERQYDVMAVGFRENAKETFDALDMEKFTSPALEVMQIYSLSSDGQKLGSNSIPEGTKSVVMCAVPNGNKGDYTLEASRLESLYGKGLILEDVLTTKKIDLFQNPIYKFSVTESDPEKRFILHFTKDFTSIDETEDRINAYVHNSTLYVRGLSEATDMGSSVTVYDLQGRVLIKSTIDKAPAFELPLSLATGVYLVKINGEKIQTTIKFRN